VRIYLDCCCLNRPFDDRRQDRVRIEADAVEIIMEHIGTGEWALIGSDALALEVDAIRDSARRSAVSALLSHATEWVEVSPEVLELAALIESAGIPGADAHHLAAATIARADVLLTVDLRLYRRARNVQNARVAAVELPAAWLERLGEEADP